MRSDSLSRLPAILALVCAAGLVLLVTACGGDDEPTDGDTTGAESPADGNGDGDELSLEEYFQRIDAIFERSDEEIDALNTELTEATGPGVGLEDGITAIDDFLSESVTVLTDAVNEMEALNEPSEVSDAQADFTAAIRDATDQAETFQEDLQGVTTEEELEELVSQFDQETTQTTQEADAACLELQGIADDNSIIVDLNCED